MPMADAAQEFESRIEQVLTEGVDAVDKLLTRNGKEMTNAFVGYTRDALERCR